MSKVKVGNITYPYIIIRIPDGETVENIGINISRLYAYIHIYKNMGRKFPYGNAYKAIRVKANRMIGRSDVKVSKRQVRAIRTYYSKFLTMFNNKYIKIPYLLYYIFKATFEIVDELKNQYPLPDELKNFIGEVRRTIFYYEQNELFHEWYLENRNEMTRNLHDDIFAGNSVLSQVF